MNKNIKITTPDIKELYYLGLLNFIFFNNMKFPKDLKEIYDSDKNNINQEDLLKEIKLIIIDHFNKRKEEFIKDEIEIS